MPGYKQVSGRSSTSQSPEECKWSVRIQGDYPIYLPDNALFKKKLVMHAHLQTLHGGVSLTMAKIGEKYGIPRLRRLTKRVINECRGCKRFHVTALANPSTGNLPKERTEGSEPFKSIGVDFAGPIKYFSKKKREMKVYIPSFACSLTRAVYLDLQPAKQLSQIPEEEPAKVEDYDLRKCAKYQRKRKDVLWKRWTTECLKALRERHNLNHQTKEATLKEGDVFLIKGEERNRNKWTCDRSERKRGRRDAES